MHICIVFLYIVLVDNPLYGRLLSSFSFDGCVPIFILLMCACVFIFHVTHLIFTFSMHCPFAVAHVFAVGLIKDF